MSSIIDAMRQVIGTPTFENGEVLEYGFAGIILCVVVACIFRIVSKVFA